MKVFQLTFERFVHLALVVSLVLSSTSAPLYAEDPVVTLASQALAATSASTPSGVPNALPGRSMFEWLGNMEKLWSDLWTIARTNPEWLEAPAGLFIAAIVGRAFLRTDLPGIVHALFGNRKTTPANKVAKKLFDQLESESKEFVRFGDEFARAVEVVDYHRSHLLKRDLRKLKPRNPKYEAALEKVRSFFISKDAELSLDFQAEHLAFHDNRLQDALMETPEGLAWVEKWHKAVELSGGHPLQMTGQIKKLVSQLWDEDPKEFREAILAARAKLKEFTPTEQAKELSENEEIRNDFLKTHAGRTWLTLWDEAQKEKLATGKKLFESFYRSAHLTKDFLRQIDESSKGWFSRNKDLNITDPKLEIKHADKGPIGTVLHTNDLGGTAVFEKPRHIGHEVSNLFRKNCDQWYKKLGSNREDHRVNLWFATGRLGILSVLGGLAVRSYVSGRPILVDTFKAEPAQLLANQLANDRQENAKIAFEATSPTKMAEKIRAWRRNPVNPHAQKLFDVFHGQIVARFPDIAADMRKKIIDKIAKDEREVKISSVHATDRKKSSELMKSVLDGFDARVEELTNSPALMEGIVELSLADASVTEGKITDPLDLESLLLSDPNDLQKAPPRDQVTNDTYRVAPKYLWPLLITDRTTYPLDFAIINPMLKETKSGIDGLRREKIAAQQKALEPAAMKATPKAGDVNDGSVSVTPQEAQPMPQGTPVSSASFQVSPNSFVSADVAPSSIVPTSLPLSMP